MSDGVNDWVHWSDRPLTRDQLYSVAQPHTVREPAFKPSGLWLSDEGVADCSWRSWCEAEGFRVERLLWRNRVTLAADHNVMILGTPEEIDLFTHGYMLEEHRLPTRIESFYIDWRKLAERHQGILITPYQYSRRYAPIWYYPWDCAGGAIWDMRAIADIVPEVGCQIPLPPER